MELNSKSIFFRIAKQQLIFRKKKDICKQWNNDTIKSKCCFDKDQDGDMVADDTSIFAKNWIAIVYGKIVSSKVKTPAEHDIFPIFAKKDHKKHHVILRPSNKQTSFFK